MKFCIEIDMERPDAQIAAALLGRLSGVMQALATGTAFSGDADLHEVFDTDEPGDKTTHVLMEECDPEKPGELEVLSRVYISRDDFDRKSSSIVQGRGIEFKIVLARSNDDE